MAEPAFAELVSRLVEAMGQQLSSLRRGPEGILLRTNDGFLFAFLEDPSVVSLEVIRRLLDQVEGAPPKLVVLTPGRLPLALQAELKEKGATVVDAHRFSELVRELGLESFLGEGARAEPAPTGARLLPSARQLDGMMHRGQHWLNWGVPALALRFYRQAAAFKPEFLPARDGIAHALLGLGLVEDADRVFGEILASHPDDVDARLGKAAVLGARGHVDQEVRIYRQLLEEGPSRVNVRTHLVAALIAEGHWPEAREEVEAVLGQSPEDPYFRFLHSATLLKTGAVDASQTERQLARALGLPPERERALCEHMGLPAPEFPRPPPTLPAPAEAPSSGAPSGSPPPAPSPSPEAERPKETVSRRFPSVLPLAKDAAVAARTPPSGRGRPRARRPARAKPSPSAARRPPRKPKKRRSG